MRGLFPECGATFTASDSEIRDEAERAASDVLAKVSLTESEDIQRVKLESIATGYSIVLPKYKKVEKLLARVRSVKWWRRQLRGRERVIEHAAIGAGFVDESAPYVSDMTFARFQERQRADRRFHKMAVNNIA